MTRSDLNARMARRSAQLAAKDAEIAVNAIFDAKTNFKVEVDTFKITAIHAQPKGAQSWI